MSDDIPEPRFNLVLSGEYSLHSGFYLTEPKVLNFVHQGDNVLSIDMESGEITGSEKLKPDEAAKAILSVLKNLIREPQ